MWKAKSAYLRKTVCEAAYIGARGPLRPADRRAPVAAGWSVEPDRC